MLEFIIRNQDAIILGSIFLFLGAALGPLIASLFRKETDRKKSPITFTQIIQIDNSQNTTINNNTPSNKAHQDDPMPIVIIAMVACCLGYLYWRQEILLAITSIGVGALLVIINIPYG